jgi:addiction module RelE/StbE family toxin
MMKLSFHRKFHKAYAKLSSSQKEQVKKVIELFKRNPHDHTLKNHALNGKQKGRRAIASGGDIRIIFTEENHYETVELLNVGTHTQVYK